MTPMPLISKYDADIDDRFPSDMLSNHNRREHEAFIASCAERGPKQDSVTNIDSLVSLEVDSLE